MTDCGGHTDPSPISDQFPELEMKGVIVGLSSKAVVDIVGHTHGTMCAGNDTRNCCHLYRQCIAVCH